MGEYYLITISDKGGVFYIRTGDIERVRHEIKVSENYFDGWSLKIWLCDASGNAIRRCDVSEF